jgi:CAAX protease family protein
MTPARTSQRKRAGIGRLIRRHPLVAFFAIAFALTWAALPWNSFMAAGPMLAAIIVTAVADGRPGLRRLRKRVFHWRVAWQWYAAAVLIPIALALGTGGIDVLFGAPGSVIRNLQLSSLAAVFATRLLLPVGAPVGEEPGWRGFALPRLLDRRSPLSATFILGCVVALWHVPLIWVAGEDLPPIFIPATIAVTFFYTWLFLRSGASVLITVFAHAVEGTVAPQLSGTSGFTGADESRWTLLYAAGWMLIAVALVTFDRSTWSTAGQRRARGTRADLLPTPG